MNKYDMFIFRPLPKFLDAHLNLTNFDEKKLKKLVTLPKDEFGVAHVNILYSRDENKAFCMLDAPNREAVVDHHAKLGQECDWIMEVEGAKIIA